MIRYDMINHNPTNLPPILTQPAPAPHLTHHGRITTCLRGQQSPNLGEARGYHLHHFKTLSKPWKNAGKFTNFGFTKEKSPFWFIESWENHLKPTLLTIQAPKLFGLQFLWILQDDKSRSKPFYSLFSCGWVFFPRENAIFVGDCWWVVFFLKDQTCVFDDNNKTTRLKPKKKTIYSFQRVFQVSVTHIFPFRGSRPHKSMHPPKTFFLLRCNAICRLPKPTDQPWNWDLRIRRCRNWVFWNCWLFLSSSQTTQKKVRVLKNLRK